eukprot:g1733.t1
MINRSITSTFDETKPSRRASGVFDNYTNGDASEKNNDEKMNVEKVLEECLERPDKIAAIVGAMRAHPTNSYLQWCAIEALANVCPGRKDARSEIVQAGGPRLVAETMGRFPSDMKVQTKGSWLVANGSQDFEMDWVENGA